MLSPPSLEKMTTPFKQDYAFGLGVRTVNGRKVISHGGGIEGFNTMLAYDPEDKMTVVVLTNLNGQAPDQIATMLAAIAHGEKCSCPRSARRFQSRPSDAPGTAPGRAGHESSAQVNRTTRGALRRGWR